MFTLPELELAAGIVHAVFPPTPAQAWPLLAARAGTEIWVKHENHTPVGAFKVRGGLTYIERLRRRHPKPPGIVSATRGNHGQSLAFAGARGGVAVTIVVPRGNSTEKNAAMRAQGARLIEHGADFDEARVHARALAGSDGLEFAPSFGPDLVVGVATWAWELFRAAPPLDLLYVPIGLGSSICGAIRTRDLLGLRTEIIGVQSAGAPAYALSFDQRRVVDINRADTNADGMATRQPDADALAIILAGAARIVTVDDAEIAGAIRAYWTDTHNLAEGAGAAPLAAALKEREKIAGKRVGLVLSGGNIDLALFRSWVLDAPLKIAPVKIATWNVNSIRQREGHVRRWLEANQPDLLLLQEIKCETAAFPALTFQALGYRSEAVGQKAYNGVAILSRLPFEVTHRALPGLPEGDAQARYLEVIADGGITVIDLYLPNGNSGGEAGYAYKLAWLAALRTRAAALLDADSPLVMAGDYNVCPTNADLTPGALPPTDALLRPETRAAFRSLLWLGLTDAVRALHPDGPIWTFWDYQAACWPRDIGLRIDHALLSPDLADRLVRAQPDRKERGQDSPSDHVPVVVEIA